MPNAVTISGSTFTVSGTVIDKTTGRGVAGLDVSAYDHDLIGKPDFLGLAVTDERGAFQLSFDRSSFAATILDRRPDLFFTVLDGGTELLNTKDNVIKSAGSDTPPITLEVDLSGDKLREIINTTPAAGWVGGFAESNPAFAYPEPDLSSLDMLKNLDNIPKLQRQQKVVWPEFSWESEPDEADTKRCYQMFAPDISRLGYTDEGRVYSIICPQQGFASPTLGSLNVEVTVTGNRGWANESDKTLAGDMTVEGRIWFAPSAHENPLVKLLLQHFNEAGLPFPTSKAKAIRVTTYNPGTPDQDIFPLLKGESSDFPIPDFARHEDLAWTVGHLGVEIGPIVKTGVQKVDEFNQLVMDVFNLASGNMLKNGHVLTWNVWFTAPELVDQAEWAAHTDKWRWSIDADHGSPDGNAGPARYFDGTPFKAIEALVTEENARVLTFLGEHL